MTDLSDDALKRLRLILTFCEYAHREMLSDRDFWEREAQFGSGIVRAAAVAVVEIGGDPK